MSEHFFPMIARMRYITRWGLMRNTDPENIQEHSHMVAVLAHALAVIQNEKFGGRVDPGAVAVAALYHDASEILTGDLPTPIKYDNPDIQGAYKSVETMAEQKLLSMLPEEFRPTYREILTIPVPAHVPGDPHHPRPGGARSGEGGRQAVRLLEVRGGTEGGQPGVQKGGRTDL